MDSSQTVLWLMSELRRGNAQVAGQLIELFYPELRRIAGTFMHGERANHTWQPTVLINELYLELSHIKALQSHDQLPDDELQKDAFLRLSAFLMKRLLIHHARPLAQRVPKTDIEQAFDVPVPGGGLIEIENLLARLAAIDPKLRAVVEMKVFEGLDRVQIAKRLDCSVRTVARHWAFAQSWLESEFSV